MRRKSFSLLLLMVVAGCGNANWSSISRSTDLPGPGQSEGLAIHLDAEQRVVLAKDFGIVCAEPSPDAISSFASSFGAGASVPSADVSAAVAQALTDSVASIGMRTQSITILRDHLYRLCEAYYGRAFDGDSVVATFARAQDLTAAVLAIEQLTGAVAARQAVVGGTAGAASMAGLSSVEGLLDAANARVDDRTQAFETTERELGEARMELQQAEAAGNQERVQSLTERVSDLETELEQRKLRLDDATEYRDTVRSSRNTALADAQATASSEGSFSEPLTSAVSLDSESAQEIADAIEHIISTLVEQTYVEETCIGIVTRSDAPTIVADTREAWCLDILSRIVEADLVRRASNGQPAGEDGPS